MRRYNSIYHRDRCFNGNYLKKKHGNENSGELETKKGPAKKEEKKEKGKKTDVGISDIKSRFILAHFHRVSTNEKKNDSSKTLTV